MPLTVLISRRQMESVGFYFLSGLIYANVHRSLYKCIAWIFLIGASAGTLTTLSFLYVLTRFPSFILRVKSEGAETTVVIRLMTFYQLNVLLLAFIPKILRR